MSQSRRVVKPGIGVGPMGSVQESSTTFPIDNSRFLIRPVLVFISPIFMRTFLLVKLKTSVKVYLYPHSTVFLNFSEFFNKSNGGIIEM